MKKLTYIFYLAVSLTLLSCDTDFLDLTPQDKLNSGDVWQDPALIELLVNDMYRSMPDGFNRGWAMLGAATDDAENSYGWPGLQAFNRGDFDATNYPFGNTWANNYRVIREANDFMENIVNLTDANTEVINRLTGEVHFLRGFFYFDLMRHYGGVPLLDRPQSLDDDLLVPRNSFDEVVDFVVADLDMAAGLLVTEHGSSDLGRATKGAALALKGRVLLYAERWNASAAASKAVIDLNNYTLFPDYEGIFWAANDNNEEVIFDKQFNDPDFGHWGHLFNQPIGYTGGWGGNGPTQELVDAYEMTDGQLPDESPLFDPNSPYDNRDPRFYATILYEGAIFRERAIETRLGGLDGIEKNGDATKTGYYMRKFLDEAKEDYANVQGSNNWIVMRYAEVLLNYAEAQNEDAGPDANVYNAMNELRARVNMPPLPAGLNKDQMRERIRNERRVELAFEEHRFFDVRRWGIAEDVLNKPIHGIRIGPNGELSGPGFGIIETENRTFLPRHYLAPIPQSEIDKNPKLEQNPGY